MVAKELEVWKIKERKRFQDGIAQVEKNCFSLFVFILYINIMGGR